MYGGAVFCLFRHHTVKSEDKMQKRHNDRYRYFKEEAATAEKYFIPYISGFAAVEGRNVLEAGCGEGGNLLPFARRGCRVTGVDVSELRIRQASSFFSREGARGEFVCADILGYDAGGRRFDVILLHDVIEHVACKAALLARLRRLLAPGGVVFVAFPAWMMPFGGHQQIARSRVVSHVPFLHLLPSGWYRRLLSLFGEDAFTVNELMSIRATRITVEGFGRLADMAGFKVADRLLWLVNPHYDIKFGLRPVRLCRALSGIPYLRDFMATSCFYMLSN